MNILGLSIGQLSTAALLVDGRIVACASEERFTRKKNDTVYPEQAINYCIKEAGIKGKEIDLVAIGSKFLDFEYALTKKFSDFSIADYVRSQKDYWYPKLYEGKDVKWTDVFRDKIVYNQPPGPDAWKSIKPEQPGSHAEFEEMIKAAICRQLGIASDRIVMLDHHATHASYAYYGSPFRDEKCLVFTIDAWGDGLNATISIADKNKMTRIKAYDDINLARLYRYITLLLGMKPNEHEYKVMGLAPYSKAYNMQKSYEIFKATMYVDGLDFKYREKPRDHYFHFKERLEGQRFDGIAAGLQKYIEEIMCQWVENAVKHTGISNVVFSGGVAMNCKAMHKIGQLDCVSGIFVCPSGSDESLAIGACFSAAAERGMQDGLEHMKTSYLGPEFTDADARKFIDDNRLSEKYDVKKTTARQVARLLAQGNVIGRCAGRMEFGARALGNRTILADPRSYKMVRKINEAIKKRDFWMPFAPTILFERQHDYLENPKNISAPFMTITFDTKELAEKDLIASLHPSDLTTRPQILKKEDNPAYYEIIKEFERLTGVGGILNTSFNLHGEPIVCSPADAMHVFENSDIDMLLLGTFLVSKRRG